MKKLLIILITFQCTFSFAQIVSLSPCQEAQLNSTGLIGEFVPQCEEDGSFASTQCWGSTGYCWCVDEYGVEIPVEVSPSCRVCQVSTFNYRCLYFKSDPGMCLAVIQMYYLFRDLKM